MFALAAVIPVGPRDLEWPALVEQLQSLTFVTEIILSLPFGAHRLQKRYLDNFLSSGKKFRTVEGTTGRACQINRAIKVTNASFIWVLHADSRLMGSYPLESLVTEEPKALYYFRLKFRQPRPVLMLLNEWGARWRSEWGDMPFGDQGFLFLKDLWSSVGGFPEELTYGEDHMFAWKLKRQGFQIKNIPYFLSTSARKYQQKGWFATTRVHLYLTIKQATPQGFGLLRERVWEKFLRRKKL